jgi:hypothetical protein
MKSFPIPLGGVVSSVLVLPILFSPANGSEQDAFRNLHALIRPQPNEDRWLQVPWLGSVWEARQRAAAEGKPILLWEMDGHPLGCT